MSEAKKKTESESKNTETETAKPATNEMALENLRLTQDFVETAGVKKLLTTVPVRKPSKQDYIRVHPSPEFRADVALLELNDDHETYLLTPAMAQELPGEFHMARVYTVINRQNVLFLWPVKLPGPDGRQLEWHRSAAKAAEIGKTKWIRVSPNMSLRAYEIFEAGRVHGDPVWPEGVTLQGLFDIAFRDYFVNRLDHPVIQRLRGLT
jgi:hypothetical protein